ncbi:hypothetical protein [Halomonas cupida]|uniref:hypothetical protein n=1 Tax=Halomonas cupida TaxID=44933 RepID=UPI003A91CACC
MKDTTFPVALLAIGVAVFSSGALADTDSAAQQRFREEGHQLDLTGFFKSDSDARSRTFRFGAAHAHDFTVATAGVYRFESAVTGGYDENYSIEAVLVDEQGNVIARDEGYGLEGGLELEQPLEPGDYALQVKAMRFGSRGRAGDGYSVSVVGLDAQGRPISDSVDDGVGMHFTGTDRDGNQSVFVSSDDAVATLGAGAGTAEAASAGSGAATTASGVAASSSSSTGAVAGAAAAGTAAAVGTTSSAGAEAATGGATVIGGGAPAVESEATETADSQAEVQVIKTDVKIRARGEVLTFNVAQQGGVHITTSTYPGGDEDTYRLTLEVLDESGSVVAEGAGEGFNGNVDLTTDLAPGRYRIEVAGQKFGSSHSGPSNYELRVELEN